MTNNCAPGVAAFRAGVGPRVVRHCKLRANEVVDVRGLAVSICDGVGCWARDAAQSQRGRDWRSRQNDRRFDTSSSSASPHGDKRLADSMFILLFFRRAATVNTYHAA